MKIKLNQRIQAIELYEQGIEAGLKSNQICNIINEALGLDCTHEGYRSLYNRYQKQRILGELDKEEHEDRLVKYTKRDIQQKKMSKALVRQRAVVDLEIKHHADRSLMAEVIERIFGQTIEKHLHSFFTHAGDTGAPYIPTYVFGDVHWDYNINQYGVIYNKDVAKARLDEFYSYVVNDTLKHSYTKIYVVDEADDIEGSALRASQLLHITESMTEQAKGYADYTQQKLEWLSENLPDCEIIFQHVDEDNHSQLRLHGSSRDELPENLQLLITNKLATFVETAHKFEGLMNLTYLSAPELIVDYDGYKGIFFHGHQYTRNDNILDMVSKRHETKIHFACVAHWHSYSHKNRDVQRGAQESLIFIPPIVGNTDYSRKLFLSGRAGFLKLKIYPQKKYVVSKQILFDN